MRIIDEFDGDEVFVSFPLWRNPLSWCTFDDSIDKTFLVAMFNFMNAQRKLKGRFSLYDFCSKLNLTPRPFYAYIGWGKDDEIKYDLLFDENQIIINLKCKYIYM